MRSAANERDDMFSRSHFITRSHAIGVRRAQSDSVAVSRGGRRILPNGREVVTKFARW